MAKNNSAKKPKKDKFKPLAGAQPAMEAAQEIMPGKKKNTY